MNQTSPQPIYSTQHVSISYSKTIKICILFFHSFITHPYYQRANKCGGYVQSNRNCDMLLFRQRPTFSGLVRSRTPPLARSSCLAFLKSSPVGAQGGMAVLLLPPYCATDSLRFPWHSDSFSSGRSRYFNSLILRSSVRYSDTIPCAYLRYDSVVIKQDQVFLWNPLCFNRGIF